jgi:3-methyl-2-oxobutanoate hydroxymethyltransferase
MSDQARTVGVPDFAEKKRLGEKIAILTAYDATMARLMDRAGVDALLVGDSLGTVLMGRPNTLEVTMDIMVHHTRAVAAGTKRALVIADMPFLSFQISVEETIRNAGRLIQEGHAAAVKLEGGQHMAETIARLTEIGIPVMGHLGMTPQSVNAFGGHRKRPMSEAERLVEDARVLEQAGVFSMVLESVPAKAAQAVTEAVGVPTIGIGAGPHCDGQVLVSYDAFGLFDEFVPSFVKHYAELGSAVTRAAKEFTAEVRSGKFPAK